MSGSEYDGTQIRQVAFPQWRRDDDGAWVRDWEIMLTRAIDDAARARLATLAEDTMSVDVTISDDPRLLRLGTKLFMTLTATSCSSQLPIACPDASMLMLRKLNCS